MSHLLAMYQGVEDLINGVETPGEGGAGEGGEHLENVGEAVVEAVKVEVAEAVAEIEQVAQEVETLRTEVEGHEERVDELHEEVAGMESMLASGNFQPSAFAHSYNKARRLNAKLGGKDFAVIGAESISDASTARVSAVTGMEGFMATVKAGAGKAIEFIKHIFNTVINFFIGIASATTALDRRRTQLAKRLEGNKLKDTIKLGAWNVGWDYEGGGWKALGQFMNSPFNDILGGALPAFIDTTKSMETIDKAKFKTAYTKLIDDIKGVAKGVAGAVAEKGDPTNRTVIGQHAGARVFVHYYDKFEEENDILVAARTIKVSFGKTEEAKKFSTGEVKNKVSMAELKSALGGAADYIDAVRENKIQQKFSKAERDRVIASMNLAARKQDEKNKEASGKGVQLIRAVYATSSSLTTTLNNYYLRVAKQMMDAVSAHLA